MSKWIEKELDKLCCIEKGDQLNKLALEVSGTYPCINGGIEPSGYTEKYNRVEDTISISEGGNSCGYVNLMKQRFWAGGHCYTLKENSKLVDKIFLYCVLKYNQEKIMQLRVGSGLPNIQRNALAEYKIYYPEDIEEQKRIAAVLTKIDELIEATQKLIDKQKNIKTGLMQTLLTCGIDDKGVIRSHKTHKFKDSELGQIPVEWECVELGKCCKDIVDCPHTSPEYLSYGVLVARTSNIKDGKFLEETSSRVTELEYKKRIVRLEPMAGDVIFTREAPVGESFVVPQNMKICLGQRVMLFRPNEEKINSHYLVAYLYSNPVKDFFNSINTGLTVQHVNVKDMKVLTLLRPPLREQNAIVSLLQKQDEMIERLESEKQKYIDIKKGLMADLLSGKVKVSA